MSKQPQALELAEAYEALALALNSREGLSAETAALLRSQHQLIGELVKVVESLMHWPVEPATTSDGCYSDDPAEIRTRAVLSKAKEQQ